MLAIYKFYCHACKTRDMSRQDTCPLHAGSLAAVSSLLPNLWWLRLTLQNVEKNKEWWQVKHLTSATAVTGEKEENMGLKENLNKQM